MTKVEQLIKAFKATGLEESEKIELDNLDRAKLIYNEYDEVVVENEHGTEFNVTDLSDIEIEIFLNNLPDSPTEIPLDLVIDMAIILDLFCDMYNCNDSILEENGIDWWYMHKLNRRVQYKLRLNTR